MYLVQKVYKINTNLFILICCMNDDGIQYMTGASWHWLIGQVIGVCSRGMVDQWGWQLAAGAEQLPHDEYEEDEHNLQICANVILVILLYCIRIISYHIISTVLYWFFMFFSLLWGLFSKSSRYCELHWLRYRAHQWMPRFRWRLDYLPSNWGRELRTLWIWDTMVTVCYARSRQVGQLSKTPWVAWLMICSCVKKRKSCMILAALKKVTAPTDCQSQLRGTAEWVSWNKSLHNWACPNPPRGDFRSLESYRFFGTL